MGGGVWVSLYDEELSGKVGRLVVGEGASGNGASIGLSTLIFELGRAAEWESCVPETARLARLCSF